MNMLPLGPFPQLTVRSGTAMESVESSWLGVSSTLSESLQDGLFLSPGPRCGSDLASDLLRALRSGHARRLVEGCLLWCRMPDSRRPLPGTAPAREGVFRIP